MSDGKAVKHNLLDAGARNRLLTLWNNYIFPAGSPMRCMR